MYLYGSLFRFSYLSSTDIPHPRPLSPSSLHQKYYWKHLDKLGNWIHICIENLVTFEKYFKCNLFPNVLRNVLRTMCHARIIKQYTEYPLCLDEQKRGEFSSDTRLRVNESNGLLAKLEGLVPDTGGLDQRSQLKMYDQSSSVGEVEENHCYGTSG